MRTAAFARLFTTMLARLRYEHVTSALNLREI